MKRYLLMLLLLAPLALTAKDDDTKYLVGAVPQDENGLVVFKQKFAVDGKTKAEIYPVLQKWAAGVASNAIHNMRTRILEENNETGLIVYRIEEWMTFKKLFLNLDRTRFRYQLAIKCSDGVVEISIAQISYYYEEDMNGENGKLYKAEEWITDKEALNKKGTKIYSYSGKFRRKTVDRVEELFDAARECFERVPEPIERPRATKILD